ncbi:O-antigen ligase family protein [Candidatus Nitrospira bockiana]
MFPVLRPLRIQVILGTGALIGFIISLATQAVSINRSKPLRWYLVFFAAGALGLEKAYALGLGDIGWEVVGTTGKQLVILTMIASYAQGVDGFRRIMGAFLLSIAVYQVHSLKAIVMGAAMVDGRFQSYLGQTMNSDYIGVFCVMIMFLTLEIGRAEIRGSKRKLYLGMAAVSCLIAVLTQTRSAFVALVLVGIVWVWRGENRFRNLSVLFLLFGLLILVGANIRTSQGTYFDRIQSIFADEDERDFNARSRIHLWKEGVRIGTEHALLGVGPGSTGPFLNSEVAGVHLRVRGDERKGFSLHQTFLQVWAERGLIGLLGFCGFLYGTYRALQTADRNARDEDSQKYWRPVIRGLQYALMAFVVGGLFMSLDNDWTIVTLAGLAAGVEKATAKSVKRLSEF